MTPVPRYQREQMAGGYSKMEEACLAITDSPGQRVATLTSNGTTPPINGPTSTFNFPAVLLKVRFRQVAVVTVSLPFLAFIFCITYSFIYHHHYTTQTHCNVWNVAPSISASIGKLPPQKYVWKVCIALHSAPRLLIAQMYYTHLYRALIRNSWIENLVWLTYAVNVAEVISLVLLSFVPSVEDYTLHKLSFASFLVCSALYIFLSYSLLKFYQKGPGSYYSRQSLFWKRLMLTTNSVSILLALYSFWRHNAYCEPGMYSIFSVFEYMVVLSNMGYHFTSYYDFYNVNLVLATHGD